MPRLAHTNRPARLFIRSDDAIDRAGSGNPGDFLMPLREPILEAKGVQLLSARIPNIFPQVPDYQRWFLYQLTDDFGVKHLRGFRLCATSEKQRYFANYADIVEQLNEDAAYWMEFDVRESMTANRYLANISVANAPDVQFVYDAKTRKIHTKNVAPVPVINQLQLVAGLNNCFRLNFNFYPFNAPNYLLVNVAPGIYNTLDDLATAINTAIAAAIAGAFNNPLTVSVVGGQLQWQWGTFNQYQKFGLSFQPISDTAYPTLLAQNSAITFGFAANFYNEAVIGNSVLSTPVMQVPGTAPGLQLASVYEAAQSLYVTELVKPYLFLNQILGYNVGELQPSSGPVASGGLIIPVSFCDLVRTQTIYVKSNLTINGTMCSNGFRDVLHAIPVNAPQLGVISYEASMQHYIWAVPENIMTISIKLIDENGQPLPMTLNAQTEFELGFLYDDSELPNM